MQQFIQILPSVTSIVWQASWQAACLAILVWGLVRVLGTRIAARWRFVLWSLVFVRLALPLLPSSPTSGFRLMQSQPIETVVLEVMPDADVLPPSPQSHAIVEVSPQFEEAEPPAQFDRVPVDDATSTSVANLPVSPLATMPWNWPLIAAVGWLLGFLVLGTRRAVQQVLLAGRSQNWQSTNDVRVESLMGKSCRRLGLRSTIRVLVSDDETGPAVTGVWWPRIVLPRSVLRDFSDEQLELILLHELAHVRRRDLWIQEALLLLRAIHWFNPCAWWVFQRLQVEREMACDELVLDMTGADSRQSYGMTLLQVVRQTNVRIPSPGLLGTSDTSSRLQRRLVMIRDYRPRSWKTSLLAMATILIAVAVGLTNPPVGNTTEEPTSAVASDVKNTPVEKTTPAEKTVPAAPEVAADKTFEIKGRCLDDQDQPLADIEVRLFHFDDFGNPPQEKWTQKSGANGEYRFANLKWPATSSAPASYYFVTAGKPKFSSAASLVDGRHLHHKITEFDLKLSSNPGTLSGRVVNERGEPLQGVRVYSFFAGVPIPGVNEAVTDQQGRYSITDLERFAENSKKVEFLGRQGFTYVGAIRFRLSHPDYPTTSASYTAIPQEINVELQPGMTVEGRVVFKGQPLAGATVFARGVNNGESARADTNTEGEYRLVLAKDKYNIRAVAKGRISPALNSFEGQIGKTIQAPDIHLVEGGFIVGKVVDKQTGQPVSQGEGQLPLWVAYHGPAFPASGEPVGRTGVAADGTFRLHVAPGENFPFLMHQFDAPRMPKNAKPIMVRDGETVTFDFQVGALAEETVEKTTALEKTVAATPEPAPDKTFEIKGRCLDDAGQPVADAEVSVIYIDRYGSPPKDRWRRQSGANGEYHFEHLKRLGSSSESTELYFIVARKEKFASSSRMVFVNEKETEFDLTLDRKPGALSGRVTTEKGEPVRGVEVYQGHAGSPIRGFAHAVTDKDGHYTITDLKRWNAKDTETFDPKTGIGEVVSGCYFYLKHPDYPVTRGTYTGIPQEVDVVLKPGITIEGLVHLKGQPATGVEVTAQGIRKYDFARVLTNQAGIYRLVLTDDQYNIRAQAKDRTCVALDSFDGPIGKVTKAPDLELIEGGFIVGKVVDMQTGKPVSKLPDGHPLRVAHHGPAYPISGAAVGGAAVADDGTYRLRVAPGENYPYLMHDIKSERTPSNATSVKPIVVREGETVRFDFHIGAEAEKSIAGAESAFRSRRMTPRIVIPKVGANRSAVQRPETPVGKLLNQLDELRSNSGSDEWAIVLRDLIQLGPAAVPELIAEMDRTDNEYMLRCLAFAMRGIGDKRAIPAMIRALPKTCVTSRSDMGYSAKDPELLAFMQQHDMSERDEKTRYSFGRAVNEFQYTLRKLTGSSHGEIEIAGVFLSGTPRQQFLQRSLYQRCAERWAAWWEQHWKEHVEDDRYAKVNLAPLVAESPGEQGFPHGPQFKIEGRHSNHLLESVRNPQAQRVFHDLDTGRVASLPAHLKVADGQPERLDDILAWAAREGFDLMGTEYTPPKSDQPHYVLRGLGLTAWQIETNRWEDLDTELQQNQPLEMGTRTDGLLAHFDIAKGQYVPEETATFLFQTREGGFGAMFVGVEVHDDTLKPGGVSTGDDELSPIAFHKGRRFAYKMFAEVTAGGKDPAR